MYKRWFILLLLAAHLSLQAASDYSIVFIHIGKQIPSYAEVALSQARMFNEKCSIIMVAEESPIQQLSPKLSGQNITFIACESLKKTAHHKKFIKQSILDQKFRDGFWRYTSERFLYLDDLMSQYDLKNVFHLENDNMLYVNLEELLPIFTQHYKGIGATFDNDQRCIPGFIYIANRKTMTKLAEYFTANAHHGFNDMEMIAKFKNENKPSVIGHLPIITTEYVEANSLVSPSQHTVKNKQSYCLHVDLFGSIFDAAALGQYLGGIDPRNAHSQPGFINESCVFNPSLLSYEWQADEKGRGVPYVEYGNKKYRINNLHIHCKDLEAFSSTQMIKENFGNIQLQTTKR